MDQVIVLPHDIYDVDVKVVIFRHEDFKGALPVYAAIACWTSSEGEDIVDYSYAAGMIKSEGKDLFAKTINKSGTQISWVELQKRFEKVCGENWHRHQVYLKTNVPDTLVRNSSHPVSYSAFLTCLAQQGLILRPDNLEKIRAWGYLDSATEVTDQAPEVVLYGGNMEEMQAQPNLDYEVENMIDTLEVLDNDLKNHPVFVQMKSMILKIKAENVELKTSLCAMERVQQTQEIEIQEFRTSSASEVVKGLNDPIRKAVAEALKGVRQEITNDVKKELVKMNEDHAEVRRNDEEARANSENLRVSDTHKILGSITLVINALKSVNIDAGNQGRVVDLPKILQDVEHHLASVRTHQGTQNASSTLAPVSTTPSTKAPTPGSCSTPSGYFNTPAPQVTRSLGTDLMGVAPTSRFVAPQVTPTRPPPSAPRGSIVTPRGILQPRSLGFRQSTPSPQHQVFHPQLKQQNFQQQQNSQQQQLVFQQPPPTFQQFAQPPSQPTIGQHQASGIIPPPGVNFLPSGGQHLLFGGQHLQAGGQHLQVGGQHLQAGGQRLPSGNHHLPSGSQPVEDSLQYPVQATGAQQQHVQFYDEELVRRAREYASVKPSDPKRPRGE